MGKNDIFKCEFDHPEFDIPTTEESIEEKLTIRDGIENGLGGTRTHERVIEGVSSELVKETVLVRTCIGCLVTSDPKDDRYPYYAGNCDWGHPTCSNHLKICDEPGCGKLICPREFVEYRPGKFKCRKHNRFRIFKQILKGLFCFFISFPEEEVTHEEEK